jgi:hypothetical protein
MSMDPLWQEFPSSNARHRAAWLGGGGHLIRVKIRTSSISKKSIYESNGVRTCAAHDARHRIECALLWQVQYRVNNITAAFSQGVWRFAIII